MRQPPPLTAAYRFPAVAGVALLAAAVTLAAQQGWVDISPLVEGPEVRRGQVWRFVTSALPHADVLHLAFNVYWLWVLGSLVEETFGHARTLGAFVLLALGSSAADYALSQGGIGLSGVVYGLFGMLWVLTRRDGRFAGAVDANTVGLFVIWFFFCIVATAAGAMRVANVAHGAGAVLGALLGMAVSGPRRAVRAAFGGAVAALVAASVVSGVLLRRWVNVTDARGEEWAQLGYEDLGAGRDADAVSRLRRAVEIDGDLAWAWYNLGVAYTRQGMDPDARRAFERAAELDPEDPDYRAAATPPPATTTSSQAEEPDGAE